MLYNKSKNRKVEDKKVLHKIRKKWVVVSSALLMALGGYAAVTHTSAVHADVNGSNNANQSINHNQENVSRLTSNAGQSLNPQKTGSQANDVHNNGNNNITDQARQLHSRIIQNSIQNNNGVNAQRNSSESSHVANSSAVKASSSVASLNVQSQSSVNDNDYQNNSYQNNHVHVNLGQTPKRILGETENTSDVGFVNVLYKDIDQSDSDANQIVGEQNNAQPGTIGQPFTESDKKSFMSEPPAKYKSTSIVNDVLDFTAAPQKFVIGVVPKGDKTPEKQTRNRIVIEYENDTKGNGIINHPDSDHWTYSDNVGKSFGTIPYETNTPQGYALDMNKLEEVSNEQSDGSFSSDKTYQPLVDPDVTFKPGTQLIQIRVKPAATVNIDYVDTATHQMVAHYTDTGATNNPFNASMYETSRIPKGYRMVGQAQNVPSTYVNNATMTIDVAKNGAVPSDNGNQTPTNDFVTIQYINESDGQPVGQTRTFEGRNNQPLSADTISRIKNGTPVGYQFGYFPDYSDGVPVYTPNGIIKADVKKATSNQPTPQPSDQSANMQIEYLDQSDGNSPVTTVTAPGKKNQPFNGDQFKNSPYMPTHYHYVSYNGTIPNTYNGSMIIMEVGRNMASMPVSFVEKNTGNLVGYGADVKGASDTSIDSSKLVPLEESISNGGQVPMNFNFDSFKNGQPTKYVNNQPIVVYVDASKSNQPQPQPTPQQQLVDVPINYINQSDGQPVGTASDYGISGQSFKNQAQQRVPNGYQYVNVISGVPSTYAPNESMSVLVKVPNTNNNNNNNQQPQQLINVPIHYIDQSNGQTVGVASDYGISGKPFTDRSQQYVPSGYTYGNVIGSLPSNYGSNEIVNVFVNKVPNNNNNGNHQSQQLVNVPVNYVDLASGQTVGTVSDYGISGKPFNDKSKSNVPTGYTFDRINGSLPADYAPSEAVSVFVTKTPHSNNGNNNNANQPFSMPVNYVYNGQTKSTVYTAPEVAGTNFDPTNYEHNIPSGYQFADYPTNNPNVYERGHAVTIDVMPFSTKPNQTVNMPIQYISNGKIVGTKTATGIEGSSFDPTQFEQSSDVPSGYQYTGGDINKPQNFEPNSIVQISVDPINTSHLVKMPIKYVDNGQVIGTSMAPGMSGTSITSSDLSPYEQNVPSGYKYANGQVQAPTDYSDGQTITIPVIPLPKGQTIANMPISYVSNGKQVGVATATGVNGGLFNPTQYENNVPRGYYYNSQDDSIQPMVAKYANGTQLTINVDPIPQGKQVADMTVNYMNGNQLVGSQSANGVSGAAFNVKPFEYNKGLLPHGYKFVGFNGNVPQTYTNGATISINVTPKTPNSSTQSTITVNYVDGQNNQVIESEPVTGWSGQPFDLSNYQSITPGGYRYVSTLQGGNVTKFTPNNQTVEIEVESNAPVNKYGQITIQYRDENNGSLMTNDSYPMTEIIGQPFNIGTFDEAPSGYHITGVYSGGNVAQFTGTPQTVVLNVAPDASSNTNNNGHNSQPVTPQYGTITVQCVDQSGQAVGVGNTTHNQVGTPFNLSTALQMANIPSNDHIVGLLNGNNVSQYTAGNQFVDVEVAPNQTSASSNSNGANVNPNPQPQSSNSTNQGDVTPQPTDNNNTANPSFNPVFNPVINNTVPQSSNSAADPANNRTNSYAPSSTGTQSIANSSVDPVNSNEAPASNVEHHNTQGASTEPTNDPQTASNQSIGSRFGHRGAAGASQVRNGSDPEPTSDPESTNDPQPTSDPEGTGYAGQQGQLGYAHTAGASEVRNGSFNGAESDDVTGGNVVSGNGQAVSNNNGSQLPQTGENDHSKDMAAVLLALGSSLSALGYAIDRRRRYHTDPRAGRFNK